MSAACLGQPNSGAHRQSFLEHTGALNSSLSETWAFKESKSRHSTIVRQKHPMASKLEPLTGGYAVPRRHNHAEASKISSYSVSVFLPIPVPVTRTCNSNCVSPTVSTIHDHHRSH